MGLMDWERDDFEHTARYRLCRAGFALSAMGLALMSLDTAFYLVWMVTMSPEVGQILSSPLWKWGVGSSVTWSTLLGPYLLWGRWKEPHWQQRAGLLVVLNLADVGLWLVRHGREFGLWPHEVAHFWLRMNVTYASSWIQFGLWAGLAADVSAHLGGKANLHSKIKGQSLAMVGFMLWLLFFLDQTAWQRGWPLTPHRTPLTPLLWIGSMMLRTVTAFQVAALCLLASRECTQILKELGSDHHALEALRSRSEPSHGGDPWEAPRSDPRA
jgi:hypothetical protein